MIYQGKSLRVEAAASGSAIMVFDRQDASVNKFDQQTLGELREAIAAIAASPARGLIVTSAKSGFIVGADIMEFTALFKAEEAQLVAWLAEVNAIFNNLEDLPIPTVSAIHGVCLGGGLELVLATDFRVATDTASLGFPEVKLGICPGFGGTVRAPRLIGADNANLWITTGQHIKARQALAEGAIDAVVAADDLVAAADHLISQCLKGKLDHHAIRRQKTSPLQLQGVELMVAFETAKSMVAAQAGPHYPAPLAAVAAMQKASTLERAGALQIEHQTFAKLARTDVAANLVQLFINEQYLNGLAKKLQGMAQPVKQAAVLGAGIMGGGIAYQSALKHVPILMKDIAQEGLELGMGEARKQLGKQVARGKLDNEQMLKALGAIHPQLDYAGFGRVNVVVEAVVENPGIKKKVLAEVEKVVGEDAIIASNTSTISITDLATALQRPERFCGMHFFNPVPVMPLVEVIRGKHTSEQTIATVVGYARALGKTPIVVNDCPGFLVNRILFPYFGAFARLLHDGADFQQVDKVMEKFGWPMGPAYLLDVVGIDTAVHAQAVMAAGFPDRMRADFKSPIELLFEARRYGQKTGSGFYQYEPDRHGKPKKLPDPAVRDIIAPAVKGTAAIGDQEILERMMVCMGLETVRCLEDGIIGSPIEADMGLILGLGFPPFRGGALRYIDSLGLTGFVALADRYEALGPLYKATEPLRAMAAAGKTFYPATHATHSTKPVAPAAK
ncbi:MAG: Multifunctional fatty acid oxidation complex subunit alpha [Pseudomonadota bacterium]|jgi:3-hydroxyacyl-CoA dehydrogenase/enoyl-CoA hydratase/3-hydroxybutyryl-CoA epimerase/enoyl-CoA isomerase